MKASIKIKALELPTDRGNFPVAATTAPAQAGIISWSFLGMRS